MKSPVFSIITITYNAAKELENTLLSVINQTYSGIEYILIDGASIDGTVSIIRRYESNISNWISEPDNGLYDAMNKGLQVATGDYVWFLNAGDVLQHPAIVMELAMITEQKGFPDILFGETDLINIKGTVIAKRRLKAPRKLTWKSFKMGMLVCHQAFIVKRSVAPDFDLYYHFSADFDWCIRCLKKTESIVNTHLRLVNYLFEGLSTRNEKKSLKERYAIMCKYYGVFTSTVLHGWFAMRYYWAKLYHKAI
jgi:glycosyltransferase involved in cell wall biosynthesis